MTRNSVLQISTTIFRYCGLSLAIWIISAHYAVAATTLSSRAAGLSIGEARHLFLATLQRNWSNAAVSRVGFEFDAVNGQPVHVRAKFSSFHSLLHGEDSFYDGFFELKDDRDWNMK